MKISMSKLPKFDKSKYNSVLANIHLFLSSCHEQNYDLKQ